MKTFREFSEQAYNPFPKPQKQVASDAIKNFASGVYKGFEKRYNKVRNTFNNARVAIGIHDPGTSYIQRDVVSKIARNRLRGMNTDNPDNMNTNKQFRTHKRWPRSVDYSTKYATPPEGRYSKPGFGGKATSEA